jgi:hypothetical protein
MDNNHEQAEGKEASRMNIKEFCNDMSTELAGWKAKMYDIISHVETLPALDRQYFAPDVNALRALISEIEDSVRKIRLECPVDFSAEARDLYEKVKELREKMGNIWDAEHIAGGYVGG